MGTINIDALITIFHLPWYILQGLLEDIDINSYGF